MPARGRQVGRGVSGVARHEPEAHQSRACRGLPTTVRFTYDDVVAAGDRRSWGCASPSVEVSLFGTEAMLVARKGLPPAIIDLLVDAARELHGGQGYFEARTSFPNASVIDLAVSVEADRHMRFGPSLLQRHLPFFVASYVERLVILLVPILFLLVPLINWLPQLLRMRPRSRLLPLVRRARVAGARRRAPAGRTADRALARRLGPDLACRIARPISEKHGKRGLHAARAHRPRSSSHHDSRRSPSRRAIVESDECAGTGSTFLRGSSMRAAHSDLCLQSAQRDRHVST